MKHVMELRDSDDGLMAVSFAEICAFGQRTPEGSGTVIHCRGLTYSLLSNTPYETVLWAFKEWCENKEAKR